MISSLLFVSGYGIALMDEFPTAQRKIREALSPTIPALITMRSGDKWILIAYTPDEAGMGLPRSLIGRD
jgi:hypothetical protein